MMAGYKGSMAQRYLISCNEVIAIADQNSRIEVNHENELTLKLLSLHQ